MYRAHLFAYHMQHNPHRDYTLCGKDYPIAYVFDEPQDNLPMCPDCMERWETGTRRMI